MANLLDTIAQNRRNLVRNPSGVLTQESTTGIQQLAANAKLIAMPTDPLSALVLGANPDQQKMMGTQAQTQAALSFNPNVGNLDTERRRTPAQRQPTQSQSSNRAQALQEASNIPRRVDEYIGAEIQKLETAKLQKQVASQADIQKLPMVAQLPATLDYVSLKSNLEAIASNPQDLKSLANINIMLGRPANQLITPDELDQFYRTSTESIASGAQGLVDKDLTVGDLLRQENFPYNEQNLALLLELSPDQVRNLSIGDLKNRIAEINTAQAQEAVSKSFDPLAGSAEQVGYQQLSRQLEESGVATTEAQLQNIEQSIASGESINFAGQQMRVADLLGDEGLSNLITEYLSSAPESAIRQDLDQSEPTLSKFIKDNETLLSELSQDMAASQTKLQSLQNDKEKLRTVGRVQLSDEIFSALMPGGIITDSVDTSKVPLLSLIKKLTPEDGEKLASRVNTIVGARPDLAAELNQVSEEDLGKLLDQSTFSSFLKANDIYQRVSNLSVDDIDGIFREYYGLEPAEIAGNIEEDNTRKALGLARSGISDTLDKDSDGIIDSGVAEDTYNQLRAKTDRPSLRSLGEGILKEFSPSNLPIQPKASEMEASLMSRLKKYTADGSVSRAELAESGMTMDELLSARQSNIGSKELQSNISSIISETQNRNTQEVLSQVTIPPELMRRTDIWGNRNIGYSIGDKSYFFPEVANQFKVQFDNSIAQLEALKVQMNEIASKYPKSHLNEMSIAESLGKVQGWIDTYQEQKKVLNKRIAREQQYNQGKSNPKFLPTLDEKYDKQAKWKG